MASVMRLFDTQGQRLYLTPEERTRYFLAARDLEDKKALFCHLLYYTGCRLSEACGVRTGDLDLKEKRVCLGYAEGGNGQRTVPLPCPYLETLKRTFGLRLRSSQRLRRGNRLWPENQSTAWRTVKRALALAGIEGPQTSPKGVRHSFGVACVVQGVPLDQIQRWMGHRQLSTTAVYLQAMESDERSLAARVWSAADR